MAGKEVAKLLTAEMNVVKIEDSQDRILTLQDLVEFVEKVAREADHPTFGRMGQKEGPDQRQQEKKLSSPKKAYVLMWHRFHQRKGLCTNVQGVETAIIH